MADKQIPSEIREGAREALDHLEGGVAAVLFGSRARGAWQRRSDWDIALITARDDAELGFKRAFENACQKGHEVNWIVLPESDIRDKCRYLGAVQRAIVRDGVPIIGNWNVERLRGKQLQMDMGLYRRHVIMAGKSLKTASDAYAEIVEGHLDTEQQQANCAVFIGSSADAAERLGKATLMALGIDPIETHDMDKLAEQASDAGHVEEAKMLRALNAHTRQDHVAHYMIQRDPVESANDAAMRLTGVMRLYQKTLATMPQSLAREKRTATENVALQELRRAAEVFATSPQIDVASASPDVAALLSHRDALSEAANEALALHEQLVGAR